MLRQFFLEISRQNWPFKIGLSLFDFKQLIFDSGNIVQCQEEYRGSWYPPKMMTSFMNSPLHKLHRILRCFLSKSCCHEKNSGTTGSNKDQLWWGGALDLSQFGCLSLAQCQLPGGCERWSALNDQLVITIGELVTEEQMNQGHQRPLMHCYHGPFPQVYCSSCGIPSIL